MNTGRRVALIGLAALAAAGAGLALQRVLRSGRDASAGNSAAEALLRLRLPDPTGTPQSMSQWGNHALLVNFWATWCEPCREEIPALVRAQAINAGKNLQIVGIAIDSADKVLEFSTKYSINYPLVIGGLESIDLTRQLGNRAGALPFTVLISPTGTLLASHLGGMNDQSLATFLQPHLGG